MKSKIVLDIDAPPKKVATLYADPANNTSWMYEVERYEPISGKPGMPGSVYRLIPREGSMEFTATVVSRLPNELRLRLDAQNVTVDVRGSLTTLPDGRTRFASEEVFTFKGVWNKAYGVLARPAIRKTHKKHIKAFKRFAERKSI